MVKFFFEDMFICFDTMHERDGVTDTQNRMTAKAALA